MNATIIALVTAFAVPLGNASLPPDTNDESVEGATSQAPPEPTILEVASDEVLQPDGLRVRWASTTYELSSGREAELFVEVDEHGRGDGLIYVDGEALVHVTTDVKGDTTSWVAPDVDLPPQVLAELANETVANEIFAGIGGPQEFPCSDFGRKAVRAAKYLWIAATHAATAVCCIGGAGVGCVLCVAGVGVAGHAGAEAADDYCD
jgi:hypothetical protein